MTKHQIDRLHALGFDNSTRRGTREYSVACTQCEALAINGVPTHEVGCPNQKHECKGCNALVEYNGQYCEDCI